MVYPIENGLEVQRNSWHAEMQQVITQGMLCIVVQYTILVFRFVPRQFLFVGNCADSVASSFSSAPFAERQTNKNRHASTNHPGR